MLLLAQTCVAEIDLQDSPAECNAMWEINQLRARRRGVTLEQHTLDYNAYWKVPHTSRRWIGELDFGDAPPEHWPRNRSWPKERPRWAMYLQEAELFVALGDLRPLVCPGAHNYGGIPDDGLHADDPPCPGAKRIYCRGLRQPTHQAYWGGKCQSRPRQRSTIPASVAAGRPQH